MNATTFAAAFRATAAEHANAVALATADGAWHLTWREYQRQADALAAGLAGFGVRRGDTVGLMLTNRPEFHLLDTAALTLGAAPFSVYNTFAPDQIADLFANAGNRVVVTETRFLEQVFSATVGGRTQVEHIVCVDGAVPGTVSLEKLEVAGQPGFDAATAAAAVQPDDVLTIIYTSGTTGPPKGVELTHANMLFEVAATTSVVPVGPEDSVISYLPDAHIANRWGTHYTSLVTGMQVVTLPDIADLVHVLPQVRPTLFGAVPQIWYRLKSGVESRLSAEPSPVKRTIAQWAIDTGRRVARRRCGDPPRRVSPVLAAQHRLADRLVLSELRRRLGLDRAVFCATGAAAIDSEALEFVLGLGLPVCEMWGMSELSCAATVNPPDAVRIGTVGTALPGVELRVADDGELLARGPLMMKGYRGEPEKTAETVDSDGWLRTGDIAAIGDDGYVRIVDRKKELMINAAGKNMSPANIEGAVKAGCPLVGSVFAVGDDRPYVVALLTLEPDALAAWASEHHRQQAAPAALADDPELRAELEKGIAAANTRLARPEQIKRFAVVADVWEPGGEELTPTMKIKRRPVAAKYADRIDALYAG